MKTLIFTGGHHTSALLVASKLKKKGFDIVWLGHKYSMKGIKNPSLEWEEVNSAGIRFIDLKAGKIHRGGLQGWLGFIAGFFRSLRLLLRIRPILIVSFGGYLAVPVVLAGFFLKIPSVTHEQTATAGLANRAIKNIVKKIFITWPESAGFFPARKTVLVGLPLRKTVLKPTNKLFFKNKKKTILIIGGKQGSHAINEKIMEILPELLKEFNVIHQTGFTSFTNDFEKLKNVRKSLPKQLRAGYLIAGNLNEKEIGAALDQASCVVSRAGAHIVYELLALGKSAVLIPLPFSFAKEQQKNAQKTEKAGLGKVLEQEKLTPQALIKAIKKQANLPQEKINKGKKQAKTMVLLSAEKQMIAQICKLLQ